MVFQEALLKGPSDAAIGLSRVGLTSLNGEPAARLIQDAGGSLLSGKAVRSIEVSEGEVNGVHLSDGSTLHADAYVSALPYWTLLESLPEEVAGSPFFSRASELESAPIVGIHLWYDRRVMDQDFVVFLDSPVQWVFNKTLIQGDAIGDGQYVCVSISGAWRYAGVPKGGVDRDIHAGDGPSLSTGWRSKYREFVRRQGALRDISADAGSGQASPSAEDADIEPVPGRRLDPNRLASDDGGRGSKRRLRRRCASCRPIRRIDRYVCGGRLYRWLSTFTVTTSTPWYFWCRTEEA